MSKRARHCVLMCALTCALISTPLEAATLFSDNFDSGSLARWSPVSGRWSACSLPGQTGYRYCQSDPAYLPPLSLAGDLGWADYSVQAAVSLDNDIGGRVGILGRVHDKYNFYEIRLEKDSAGTKRWWIYKSVSNVFTAIASGPFEYHRATEYVLRLTMEVTTLTAAVSTDHGGTFHTLGKGTDSKFRVGRIGLKTRSTAATFDRVVVLSAATAPPNTHRFGHVVLVTLENHSVEEVLGSPYMPYFNHLAARYALARNFYANGHPSGPNYFVWTTGRYFFQSTPLPAGTNNVVKALNAAGKSWRGYFDEPASFTNVFQFLPEVAGKPSQLAKVVPISPNFLNAVSTNTLPKYSMIHADEYTNGHSCRGAQPCLVTTDNWLRDFIGPYLASPGFTANHDLAIIAWDEGNLLDSRCSGPITIIMSPEIRKAGGWTCGGHTVFIVASSDVKPGYVSKTIFPDESTLRVMLEGLGITTNLPGASAFAPNMNEFFRQ
jgi:phosphoesterase family protein